MLPKDIKPLTGIRFFAAFWVVLFHFRDELYQLVPGSRPLAPFILLGHYAVPLFFILSGFILSHTYFSRYSLRAHAEFIYLRFARLWPVHLAAILFLLLYIGCLALKSGHLRSDNYPFLALPAELAMVRCWITDRLLWNYPAWSIQSEWFAYLFLFPIAFLCFRNASRPFVLMIVVGGLLALQSLVSVLNIPGKCADIAFLFLAGSALYRLRVLLPHVAGHWAANGGLIMFGVGLCANVMWIHPLLIVSFGLVIFGLSYEGGMLAKLLSQRLIVYGGTISYSIYMTHALVHKVFATVVGKLSLTTEVMRFSAFLLLIAAVFVMAIAFYHLIEAPCNTALRARLARRRNRTISSIFAGGTIESISAEHNRKTSEVRLPVT